MTSSSLSISVADCSPVSDSLLPRDRPLRPCLTSSSRFLGGAMSRRVTPRNDARLLHRDASSPSRRVSRPRRHGSLLESFYAVPRARTYRISIADPSGTGIVLQGADGDERGCIDLCAWSTTRGAPHRPASTRISMSTPRRILPSLFLLTATHPASLPHQRPPPPV